jgi:hypothetical protein
MVNCVGLAESRGVARYFIAGSGFTVVDKRGGNGLFVLYGKILDTSTDPLPSDWTVPPDAHTFRPMGSANNSFSEVTHRGGNDG